MTYAEAIYVCKTIEKHDQDKVLSAVEKILSMTTINAVPKEALLNVVRWFWGNCVDQEET